jgi:hypothetical protein
MTHKAISFGTAMQNWELGVSKSGKVGCTKAKIIYTILLE